MKRFILTSLCLCEGNPPAIGGFSSQRESNTVIWFLFDIDLDELLNKQWNYRWFGRPWRSCDVTVVVIVITNRQRRNSRPVEDVIKWKHFPRYWPFARETHRSPVNSPYKGQRRGALMFSLICVRINGWVNNRQAGDLRRYRAHYYVIVMYWAASIW